MKIEDWRAEIDEVDKMIVHLLNRRAELVTEIGRVKQSERIPICDPAREAEVLNNVCCANQGPLHDQVVERLFRAIIAESKSLECSYEENLIADSEEPHTAEIKEVA